VGPDDILGLGKNLLPSWRRMLGAFAGIILGFATYMLLEPWPFVGWVSVSTVIMGFVAGVVWQARRDSARPTRDGPN
jgi:hypothetical protein